MPPDLTEHEPLRPDEARELYLADREREVSDATLQAHGYRLEHFVEFCDEQGIDNMNDVTGRTTQRYKISRSEGVNNDTLKSQLDTIGVYLRFCEGIEAIRDGFAEIVQSPSLSYDENRSDAIVSTEKAEAILGTSPRSRTRPPATRSSYSSGSPGYALARPIRHSPMIRLRNRMCLAATG